MFATHMSAGAAVLPPVESPPPPPREFNGVLVHELPFVPANPAPPGGVVLSCTSQLDWPCWKTRCPCWWCSPVVPVKLPAAFAAIPGTNRACCCCCSITPAWLEAPAIVLPPGAVICCTRFDSHSSPLETAPVVVLGCCCCACCGCWCMISCRTELFGWFVVPALVLFRTFWIATNASVNAQGDDTAEVDPGGEPRVVLPGPPPFPYIGCGPAPCMKLPKELVPAWCCCPCLPRPWLFIAYEPLFILPRP